MLSVCLIPVNHAVSTFKKRPFYLDCFELCNFKRVRRKQHALLSEFKAWL